MFFSVPLRNSAAHYYYLVYLWPSFIPSLPLALWKANNYNTLKYCINTEHLKMNHTYLHFSFLACNYFYQSAMWYKSHLLSWHIKSSLIAGVFLFLVYKSRDSILISKQHQSAVDVLKMFVSPFIMYQISYSKEFHILKWYHCFFVLVF